ncbi:MAG: nucleotide exchange factor GrpE [Anaerolineaceae bacterium]|jgi:molecular chaperone GrpE|nr:MAG: nucleotide exchange factor GrpE [Anaerolineaceae bacterium]
MEEKDKNEKTIEKPEKETPEPGTESPKGKKVSKETANPEAESTEEMVTIPLKSMEEQLKEIDDLKDKVTTYSEGWQRERADFDNYRKRVLRDRDQEKQNLTVEIIKKYLVLHDDLRLALKNAPTGQESKQWVDGIALILKKMQKILEAEGIEPIDAEMDKFNPQFHEAISHEENPDYKSGQIIEVIKPGYKIENRVIRPALVRVAK